VLTDYITIFNDTTLTQHFLNLCCCLCCGYFSKQFKSA